ncbi:MAG: glutaredoxin family protein [Chloroflexota bacterium]
MSKTHVAGKKAGDLMLYALSTCPWCRRTKKLLDDLGVDYSYTDVDLLTGAEKEKAVNAIKKFNPDRSLPTLVINNERCIVGFQEDAIREAVKSGE